MRSSTSSGLLVMAVALIGCGSWRPPPRVALQYAGAIRSRDVDRGEHVFETRCVACHRGRVNPAGYHWTPGHMRHQIREGNRLMPALTAERLSDDDVEAVLAYLSTVGAIDGDLPPHPDEWPADGGWSEIATYDDPPVRAETSTAPVVELASPILSTARALGAP